MRISRRAAITAVVSSAMLSAGLFIFTPGPLAAETPAASNGAAQTVPDSGRPVPVCSPSSLDSPYIPGGQLDLSRDHAALRAWLRRFNLPGHASPGHGPLSITCSKRPAHELKMRRTTLTPRRMRRNRSTGHSITSCVRTPKDPAVDSEGSRDSSPSTPLRPSSVALQLNDSFSSGPDRDQQLRPSRRKRI